MLCKTLKLRSRVFYLFKYGDKVFQGAGKPIEFPHQKHIIGAKLGKQGMEFGSVPSSARSVFIENALAPCGFEGVHLGGNVLVFFFGNAGVSEKHRKKKNGFDIVLRYETIVELVFETVKWAETREGERGFQKRSFEEWAKSYFNLNKKTATCVSCCYLECYYLNLLTPFFQSRNMK